MQKSVTFLCIERFLSLIPRRYQLLNAFINLISTLGERSTMLNVRNSSCMISEMLKCVYTDVSSNGRSVQKRELYQQKTLLSLKQMFLLQTLATQTVAQEQKPPHHHPGLGWKCRTSEPQSCWIKMCLLSRCQGYSPAPSVWDCGEHNSEPNSNACWNAKP